MESTSSSDTDDLSSPSGLMFTTDEKLYSLLADLENWKANLPANLKYRGPDTPQNAGATRDVISLVLGPAYESPCSLGLLHLLYSCVCMIFWRVFMRISYSCPAHLKFGLTVETWSVLVQLTGESIDWLDAHERMYDVWLLVAYAATSCALVQVRYLVGAGYTPSAKLHSSIIHGLGDKTPMLLLNCGNYGTAYEGGKGRYLLITCLPDAR